MPTDPIEQTPAPKPTAPPLAPAGRAARVTWSPWLALIFVLIVFIGTQYAGALVVSLYPIIKGWSAEQAEQWMLDAATGQFFYVLLVEAMTLGLIILFLKRRERTLRDIGLLKIRLKDIGAALLAYPPYFLLNALALIIASVLFGIDLDQKQQTGFENAQAPLDLALTFVSLVILPPIVEEIVMRGFLFTSLMKSMRVIPAALVTSVIFALAHLQFGSGAPLLWAAAIDTFILSLVLCYLRYKTGSLWAGIIVHSLKNGLAFYALFILST